MKKTALYILAAALLHAVAAGTIQFASGTIDTTATPSLRFAEQGGYVTLQHALAAGSARTLAADVTVAADTEHHYLLQLRREHVAGFASLHAPAVIGFLPDDALVLKATAAQAQQLARHPAVTWINVYPAEFKVSERLRHFMGVTTDRAGRLHAFATAGLVDELAAEDEGDAAAVADTTAGLAAPEDGTAWAASLDDAALAAFTSAKDPASVVGGKKHLKRLAAHAAAPQRTLSVMVSAPAAVDATLAHYEAGLAAVHADAAAAAAREVDTLYTGASNAVAGAGGARFATMAARAGHAMRTLGIARPRQLLAALRVAGAGAGSSIPPPAKGSDGGFVPLSVSLKAAAALHAAPRDNQFNAESVAPLAFSAASPLFLNGVDADVDALVAEAAGAAVHEVRTLGAEPARVASASALADHVTRLTRALAAAASEAGAVVSGGGNAVAGDEADDADEVAEEGEIDREADAAIAGATHMDVLGAPVHGARAGAARLSARTLAHAVKTTLALQTQWVSRALSSSVSFLAAQGDVLHVDLKPSFVPLNRRARWVGTMSDDRVLANADTYKDQLTPFHAAGLTGDGQVVGVGDSGVDGKSCFFYDRNNGVPFGEYNSSKTHRKFTNYVPFGDQTDTYEGHGTHVCGTIAGSALTVTGTVPSSWSRKRDNGVAPDAKISFFDLANAAADTFEVPDDVSELLQPAYDAGARIHSDSWGCGSSFDQLPSDYCNYYSNTDFYFDRFLKRNPSFIAIIANGNDGAYAYKTVGSPATAKNVISVGASSQSLKGMNESAADGIVPEDSRLTQSDYYATSTLAYFSSLGPTIDGRIKPDVVAPGHTIKSACAEAVTISGAYSCETLYMSGTSMATPLVAGLATLAREYLVKGYYGGDGAASPSAAIAEPDGQLVKALVVNSGQQMERRQGQSSADPVPLPRQTTTLDKIDNVTNLPVGNLLYATTSGNYTYYAQPTNSTAVRSLRLLVDSRCSNTQTISYWRGFPDSMGTPVERTITSHIVLDINAVTGDKVKFVFNVAASRACPVYFGILEYDNAKVSDAPRARSIGCGTRFGEFPSFNLPIDTIVESFWTFICPAPATCLADKTVVRGISMYTADSSICRAAIHTAAIDATLAQQQAVSVDMLSVSGGTKRVYSSSQNGVTSLTGSVSAGQSVYMPNIAGTTAPDYNTLAVDAAPNSATGFGRVDLAAALPLKQKTPSAAKAYTSLAILSDGSRNVTDDSVISVCFLASFKPWETVYQTPAIDYTYATGDAKVKVTLAYADYAQTPGAAKALVNDVDLHVFGPRGDEYRGNACPDRLNNVEQVAIPDAATARGLYCAVAHGQYVPLGAQAYALVANGPSLEVCGANPMASDAAPLSGAWTVASYTCDAGVSANMTGLFTAASSRRVVQAGNCVTLRNGGAGVDAGFFGQRLSTATSTEGYHASTATHWAAGKVVASGAVTMEDNLGYSYASAAPTTSEAGARSLMMTVQTATGADAGKSCTLTLTQATAGVDAFAAVYKDPKADIPEPQPDAAFPVAAPSALLAAVIAAILAALLF